VTHALAAAVLAAVLSIVAGPRFIVLLRRLRAGQHIREDGPAHHQVKQGTPTMGGLLIIASATLAFLALTSRTGTRSWAVLATVIGCGAIGFADDWLKVVRRRSLGLRGRWKLIGQGVVAAGISYVAHHQHISTSVYVPVIDRHVALGVGWYLLVFLMVLGATNAVNLTDGLDGLAAGVSTLMLLVYTGMGVVAYQFYQRNFHACHPITAPRCVPFLVGRDESLDLTILAAALLGACIGFLWYNSYPADVFMGDTGSLALGGAIAAFAVFTKTELLLPLVAGVCLIEALSVIIQVISFKRFGRRVFLMAPIHHHFEMRAWSETRIMVRFWIVSALCVGAAFVLFYLRFQEYGA
jgi:phospho-N-acetylmuramoyl-pentapeptide-transferase